jgi:hypothetical protein
MREEEKGETGGINGKCECTDGRVDVTLCG